MSFHLPNDLESGIRAEVRSGHFASEDAVVAAAVRMFLQLRKPFMAGAGSIGAMRDDAVALDTIVEEAMKIREERPWRNGAGE